MTYSKSKGKYPLTPITSDWMKDIMAEVQLLEELTKQYGSPINLHHIPSFRKNIDNLNQVFKTYNIDSKIYFARKANKSKSLVRAAIDFKIGVDTASYNELEEAIDLGASSDDLVLTAAVKTTTMLKYAIENNVLIIIDNHDELRLTQKIAKDLNVIASIGIRLSGFKVDGKKLYSRFGFDIDKDIEHLKIWFSQISEFHNIYLQGFHFHLDGYSIVQRAEAILQTLELLDELNNSGCKITFLDIGGGILINYLDSKEEWENFKEGLQMAVLERSSPITFMNNGLGLRKADNENSVVGELNTYPYYNEINGSQFLEKILTYKKNSGPSVYELVNDRKIQLRIEPGRALLQEVGMTIAKVAHRKKDANGTWLVGLEMNMSQLKSSSADFLLDPFVIYQKPVNDGNAVELYLTGAYCLEQDVILKRKLTFPKLPEIGDFVVFINTGGYMMHFYETEAHLFELSTNLYILDTKDNKPPEILVDDLIQN
ncbi:Y4yA family PLP-dependent enzyme [Arenibacter algicola]|uniref:Y4yA family PLP-dependent enzyme n=1 Tax=Arenibacter algicola TaxID=616991 RepID=UPI001C07D70F|nr:Y4yA family PLP-dependent enzyme [Arenibacter algicola]MBU2905952.1 Y4yA family PLP-dependent enzyme [Arenibacter algicola]